MSEYVRKQPLLEILKQESGSPKRMYDTKQGIKWAIEQIESGAFDADTSEVKRLRAIEQAIRDFQPTTDQRAGYDALVAWLESTTPFQAELDVPDESTAYGNDCRDGKCEW